MITWFNVYNKTTFEAEDIPSKNLTLDLGDFGQQEVMITKGNHIGIFVAGVFLMLGLEDLNPFYFEGLLAYLDEDDEIFLGIYSED